jgi:hypothetical protein
LASPDLNLHCRDNGEGRHTGKGITCVQDTATVCDMWGVGVWQQWRSC